MTQRLHLVFGREPSGSGATTFRNVARTAQAPRAVDKAHMRSFSADPNRLPGNAPP